jgi:hypothetical protein
VSGVGCGGGVASPQIVGESGIDDGTGESAIADAKEFSIPARNRQPYLEPNVGIAGRTDHSCETTKGRKFVERTAVRRHETSRRHGLGGGDGRIRKAYAGETGTIGGAAVEGGCGHDKGDGNESAY